MIAGLVVSAEAKNFKGEVLLDRLAARGKRLSDNVGIEALGSVVPSSILRHLAQGKE